jgi:hypothetical protein
MKMFRWNRTESALIQPAAKNSQHVTRLSRAMGFTEICCHCEREDDEGDSPPTLPVRDGRMTNEFFAKDRSFR